MDGMVHNAQSHAFREYWKARLKRRADRTQDPEGALVELMRNHPEPAMDMRIWATQRRKCQTSKALQQAIFRSNLWWDHLPSPQVLARRSVPRTQKPPIPSI